MTKIILGNGNDLSVSDDNSNGDTIIVGNGVGDSVSAVGSSNDTITLGNGAGDTVNVGLPLGIVGSSNDTITLGNGDGDTVTAARSNFDTITLGNGVGDTVDSNTLNVDGTDTGFTDTITLQGKGGSHVTIAGGTTNATTLAMSSRDLIGNGTPSIAGRHTGADKLQAGSTSVGDTLDVLRTIDSDVVPPNASSFASDFKIKSAATSATGIATTSGDQTLKFDGTDAGLTTTITSGGLTLSLSSAVFMKAGSTTTITSGGLTTGNTLALWGTVSNVNSSVRVYDGATLLGTATFSVEDPRSWGFVTAVLPDGSHSFTVTATDNAGNTATTSAVTATIDATPPNVISVLSRVRGSVKTGEVVQITLNMSEAVTVFGAPGLLLNDGGTATYASGSGTRALTFEYTVPSDQGTSDLRVIGDTLPSSAAIQDLAGNAADLSAAGADLHLKVGSTTTTATTTTLAGTQQTELFGPSSVNVTFASGATGSLILDASSQFTGTIAGLNSSAPFETIDLAEIAFGSNTTVVYSASSADTGMLTVSDGTNTANIALLGQYGPTSFTIASDGHGGTAVVDPVLSISGSWSGVFSWPLIGIQSLLLPDGKILTYGTDQSGLQGAYKIYDVWDPITNTHDTLPNQTFVDEFCGAAQIIPTTGQVLIAGGDARPLGSINTGIANTNIFDYGTDSLTYSPFGPMAFARWYPTLITLDTGQLLILGGLDFSGAGVGYPEIFTPGAGWRTLTGAYIAEIANGSGWYYPRAWQASDGKVIAVAAGGTAVYAIDPSGNGQVSVVAQAPVSLDFGEPAIMFAPDRCLILGSDGSVWVMDISGPTPVFTPTGGLAPDRIWSNLTVLPDGRVMVSGGSAVDSNNNPSLSVKDADNTVAIWDPSTGLWTSTGANAAVPRLYHSTAILLPDATVLSLGGGGLDPNDPSMNHLNGEIYNPGYLFDTNGAAAVRPVIQQAPPDLSPGQTFTVRVDNPANIRTLAMMPFGSTTHAWNTTARRIELSFSVQADGSLSVTLPANSDVVPPGDWMLFAIGNNGTPSIASTIHVNPYLSLNNTLGTDAGLTATITSLGITKDNTLALSGTLSVAKGFSSVQVYDGATLLGPVTVSSGNWSYTTSALLDGSHSFTAKATDNAGNTTTTFAVTATVDTTPPTETISTTINTDTGATTTISSGGVTRDNTLGLSGTVSDANGVSSVQMYDGATLLGAAVVTGGYTAGYAFNESSGNTTADATGHGITGTLVNGATFTTAGKYGNALALNGVNSFVDLGNSAALQLQGSMTVSAWINATAFPVDDAAVVSRRDSSNHGFQLDTTVDTGRRTIGFKLTNSAGVDMIRYGATTLQTNTWYYIAGVYDAAAQTLHVYLNGQLDDGQLLGTVTATQQASPLDVEIGQRAGNPGAFQFNGRIDDVRIADHAITQSQIQTDMATPLVAGSGSAGNWSYTTPALLDGNHSFTAKATDNAGNTTTTSAVTATVNTGTVDTTPPTETISTTINTDTGATTTISSGGVTKDNTLSLSGAVSDASGVSSVQIYDGATLLGAATINSGNWSYTTLALLDGNHSFTAKATDNAGNTTTTSAVTATVDTTPPTETISTTINTNTGATTTISSGGVTKDNTLGLSGTVSDASGVSSVQVYDGATLLGAATINSGNWSYTTLALLDGSHSFTAKTTDNAGNTTTTSAVTATVDTTPPTETISTTINTNTGATTTISSGGVTKDNTLSLSGAVSDASGVSSVQVYDGATLLGAATINSGNWSYTTLALLDGNHSFTAKATDNAGNTTTTFAVTATVDTTPPTETISTTINTDTGATTTISSGGVTKDNTLGLSGTVSDASGVSSVQVYDGATLLGAATINSGNWSYTTLALLDGSHSFTAKTTDNAGNTTTTSAVTATVDTTPPTETISTTINTNTGATTTISSGGVTKDNTLSLSGAVSDASGVSSVQVYDGATLLGAATINSGNWSYTTLALLDGNHSFTAKATDNAGNTTTTFAVTATVDTTPPTETISTTINTDTGATTTISSGGVTKDNTLGLSGTVSDASGVSSVQVYDGATLLGAATINSGNWSYTTLALLDGNHSFTAKATDNAGNTTTTSAVTATVNTGTVDTTPPTETISTTINTDTGATTTISSGGVTKDNTLGLSGTVSDASGVSSVQVYDGATLLGAALVSSSDAASYPFNESSGTTTADATGHGITGTLVNGATFTTAGKYGNALALDGVNDYVDLGNPGALQLTGSMTVSAWIYATAFPGDDAAVVSDRNSGNLGFQLDTTVDTGSRTIGFKLTNSAGVDMIRYGATTLQTNTWYYIAGVYDAAAQTLHVYLNGQLDDGQLLGTVTATQQASPLDVEIGQRPGNPGAFQFNGRIDDVRIANQAITQSQVQADMATPAAAGGWSYTTPALLDGSHSFTAKATDNAGNTTTTFAVTATVDTTPPTETISTTINTDTGATTTISSGGVTKDNTLGLSGTVSDASGVSSVQVYDGATLLGAATINSGNWSYTTPALLDGSHSFTAKATDNAGNTTTTSALTATVDTTPPTLAGIVASPATANLNAGKTVTLTANFSGVVAVGSGTPTLNLNDGGTATYVSGSNSSALTFTYTIAAGQNTSDLQVTGFNGATIQDGAGNSANLSGITAANPVNPTGTLKIDTTAPTVISDVASPSTGTIATGKAVKIKLNMSENVTVATGASSPTLLLNDGGTAPYTSGSGTNALTFTYTVPQNQGTADLQVVGITLPSADSIQDLAGNNANLSGAAADLKLKVDTVTTTASSSTISGTQSLELFGASAENITFSAGSTGTLRLDAATSFSGTVAGLALGNALDLANVAYTAGMPIGYQPNTSGPAGGLLTVGSANIALLGNYMASMFVASSDGRSGTLIADPPLNPQTLLVQPHA